jgi:hypothetical protein
MPLDKLPTRLSNADLKRITSEAKSEYGDSERYPLLRALAEDKGDLLASAREALFTPSLLPGEGLPEVFATFGESAGVMNSHERGMVSNSKEIIELRKQIEKASDRLGDMGIGAPSVGKEDCTNSHYLEARNNLSMLMDRYNRLLNVSDADSEGRLRSGRLEY